MEEKIKITIPESISNKISADCEKFIVLKPNGDINRNLFLNTVVLNFYQIFSSLEETTKREIDKIIFLHTKKSQPKLTKDILKYLADKEQDSLSNNTCIINIKPTKQSSEVFKYIESYLLTSSSISSYYRRLFEAYAKYPQYKREQIICQKAYQNILQAISKKKKVHIILKNKQEIKEASIYTIEASSDELYNYLVYETVNGNPATLRLSKIQSVQLLDIPTTISKDNIELFEKQMELGIQYPIYSLHEEPVKVKFTEKGIKMFQKVYLYRPIPSKIEGNIYTFNCSHYQIVYYFKRFGIDAIILSPEKLTHHLQQFYFISNKDYKKTLEKLYMNDIMAIER